MVLACCMYFVITDYYVVILLNSSMKTSSDVVRQTRKFYAQANMLLRNFHYCTNDVKCTLFKSYVYYQWDNRDD